MNRTNCLQIAKVFQVLGNHTPAALLAIPSEAFTHPNLIAKDIEASTAAVSTILGGLEKRRLITRKRSLEDIRKIEVRLTKAGLALQEAMINGLHGAVIGGEDGGD